MGTVFLARNAETDQPCALKLLASENLGNDDQWKRFRREIETLSRFKHPHIVRILSAQPEDASRYFVMEYVNGKSVAEIIADGGTIHWKQVIEFGIQICSGLKNAHDHGIVHRDLKPANLLVDTKGLLKIADFGIAKPWFAAGTAFTQTGTFVGTAEYMSPEQAEGESASSASDLYGLGAVLYAMLTGKPPFQASSFLKLCQVVIHDPVVPPSEHNPRVPLVLEQLIGELLEKDAKLRPGNAYSVRRKLERMKRQLEKEGPAFRVQVRKRSMPGEPAEVPLETTFIAAHDTEPTAKGNEPTDDASELDHLIGRYTDEGFAGALSERFYQIAAVCEAFFWNPYSVLAILTVVTALFYAYVHLNDEVDDPEGRRRANLAHRAKSANTTGRSKRAEETREDRQVSDDVRKLADAYRQGMDAISSPQELEPIRDGRGATSVTILADGATLATEGGGLVHDVFPALWDLTTAQRKPIRILGMTQQYFFTAAAFSPDGKTMASVDDYKTISLWDLTSGERRSSFFSETQNSSIRSFSSGFEAAAFSPDGGSVALGCPNNTVALFDAESGTPKMFLRGHTAPIRCIAYSEDGQTIASGSDDTSVILWDVTTGLRRAMLAGHTADVNSLSFLPDGNTLASLSGIRGALRQSSPSNLLRTRQLILWDLANGEKKATLSYEFGPQHATAFAPDGKSAVFADISGNVKLWKFDTDEEPVTLGRHSGFSRLAAISPDLKTVASASRSVKLWDVATGETKASLVQPGSTSHYRAPPVFSPDGTIVAVPTSRSPNYGVEVWDVRTGGLNYAIEGYDSSITRVGFSPDGQRLASLGADGDTRLVKIWNVANGELLTTIPMPSRALLLRSLAFAPDEKSLAVGCKHSRNSPREAGEIFLYDLATGEKIIEAPQFRAVINCMTYSPDGETLVIGYGDGNVRLWDPATGEIVGSLSGHSSSVTSLAFSPDGTQLVSGGGMRSGTSRLFVGELFLWDLATTEAQRLAGHRGVVLSVAFSRDGKRIASVGDDSTVKLWDVATGNRLVERTFRGHRGRVQAVGFSPDGTTVASAGSDAYSHAGTIAIWDVQRAQQRSRLRPMTSSVRSIAYSHDGRTLAAGCSDKSVRLWDTASGRFKKSLSVPGSDFSTVAFSPDGKMIAAGERLLEIATGNRAPALGTLPERTGLGVVALRDLTGTNVQRLVYSPTGETLAAVRHDSTVALWNVASGECHATLDGHAGSLPGRNPRAERKQPRAVTFSPNGTFVATAGAYYDDERQSRLGEVRLWEVATGRLLIQFRGHSDSVHAVAFGPESEIVASAGSNRDGSGEIILWDVSTGTERMHLAEESVVRAVAFSGDGETLASAGDGGTVLLWNVTDGGLQETLDGNVDGPFLSVAFSSDGQHVAALEDTGSVKLWNLKTAFTSADCIELIGR
jgi:WD40 repeat protein/serine/threonine protein kinase